MHLLIDSLLTVHPSNEGLLPSSVATRTFQTLFKHDTRRTGHTRSAVEAGSKAGMSGMHHQLASCAREAFLLIACRSEHTHVWRSLKRAAKAPELGRAAIAAAACQHSRGDLSVSEGRGGPCCG
jgi:hypothetical protein